MNISKNILIIVGTLSIGYLAHYVYSKKTYGQTSGSIISRNVNEITVEYIIDSYTYTTVFNVDGNSYPLNTIDITYELKDITKCYITKTIDKYIIITIIAIIIMMCMIGFYFTENTEPPVTNVGLFKKTDPVTGEPISVDPSITEDKLITVSTD